MTGRAITVVVATVAATAIAVCASASPGKTRASVTVSLAPDRAGAGRWCATAIDAREPEGRKSLCQPRRGRVRTEAVLAVDCPTHRVVLLGLAPRRLRAVSVIRKGSSETATLARRKNVTAFAVAATLSDFPARLRTSAGARVRTRALRDPHIVCRSNPGGTSVIDALHGP
jgi:hypothetical protein